MSIPVVVLTGGPQGGKTSALDAIRQEFADKVVIIPEAATTLLASYPLPGRDLERNEQWLVDFQKLVISTQIALEKKWLEVARARHARLVIADRGLLDSIAYLPDGVKHFMSLSGLALDQVHERYDLVIHLESVATCAPEKFGKIGNAARYETLEEGQALELALREAWSGHPNWVFVPGAGGVASVISQVVDQISEFVYREKERKFLLPKLPDINLGQGILIVQGYIVVSDSELRVRKMGSETTIGIKTGELVDRQEWEKRIPKAFFDALYVNCSARVSKIRYVLHDQLRRKWEIDQYNRDLEGLITAECEYVDDDDVTSFELPEWLVGAIDVTEDPVFKNKNLATQGLPDLSKYFSP